MPSNSTKNYHLNQWSKGDKVLMDDFNADNAKTDAAIKGEADARAAGDAALSARLDGLSASKADVSALSALSQTVAGKGNCKLITGTYTGTGEYGEDNPNTLTFPQKPLMVFICSTAAFIVAFPDKNRAVYVAAYNSTLQATWDGNTLSWYGNTANGQLNGKDYIYRYIAFAEA